jgi:TonB family protein
MAGGMRRKQTLALPLGAVLLVGFAACATKSAPRYPELGPASQAIDGLAGRRCHYAGAPVAPQNLDPLARPGARGALLLRTRDMGPADTLDVSIRYDGNGRLAWVRRLRSTMAAGTAATLERVLTESLLDDGPPDWGVRVRMVGGRVDAVLPSVLCPAVSGPLTGSTGRPIMDVRDRYDASLARGRSIELLVGLDEEGRVTGVQLARSSGSRVMDQYAVDVVRSTRFLPMLHDGYGVPTVMPVRFRVPTR